MSKVIILGFPHCGTSILKSIIGHCTNVEEIYDECDTIEQITNKDFIVCKWPFIDKKYFTTKYDDYTKIMIIRNPLYVFTSLNKRFDTIPINHTICEYDKALSFVNYDNIKVIKYEEMFDNNFYVLKNLFDEIGFMYSCDIFNNELFDNYIDTRTKLPNTRPSNSQHIQFRTWQINQKFENKNKEIIISQEQLQQIQKSKNIQKVYPDVCAYKF